MIFQEPMTSLNPVLRIGLQIMEPLTIHLNMDEKAARERAIELLTLVGITDPESRLAQYPHQLSGGMRQRVMIAIGLACNPKLLIADEPTTALDVTIQAQILELMKDLSRRLGDRGHHHHAQPGHRRALRRPRERHVRRAPGGERNGRAGVLAAAASLCARPARGGAAARPRAQRQAGDHRRRAAQPAGAAGGLPVPPALPRSPSRSATRCRRWRRPSRDIWCPAIALRRSRRWIPSPRGLRPLPRSRSERERRRCHPRHQGMPASSFPSAAACSARRG